MSLGSLSSFLVGLALGVVSFLVFLKFLSKKRRSSDVLDVQKTSTESAQLSKIEVPEHFRVQEGDFALEFKRSDEPLERFLAEGYVEVESEELLSAIKRDFLKTVSERNKKLGLKVPLEQLLEGAAPLAASFHVVSKILPQRSLYVLSRPLKVGEELFRYKDGTLASFLRTPDGKIGEHIGYDELMGITGLRLAATVSFIWIVGNYIFGTINLHRIHERLETIEEGIQALLGKWNSEKLARLRALEERIRDLYAIPSYHTNHLLEVDGYQKELLELYYYYLSEIERNSEIDVNAFRTSRKIKELKSKLSTTGLLEDLGGIFESVYLLRLAEILKLKIMISLRDVLSIRKEFFQILEKITDDEKLTEAKELYKVAKENVLDVAAEIEEAAILHQQEAAELRESLEDFFSDLEGTIKSITNKIKIGKEIANRFINALEKSVNYVFVVEENGKSKVLAKVIE